MVKPELGTKRTCPSCGARFYDMLKNPIVCPKCGVSFIAPTLLPSKGDLPGGAAVRAREPVPEPNATPDVEIVSLEEVAAVEEDEAAIADVDLEEGEPAPSEEEDTFLEEEEEEGSDVAGYLDTGPAPKEGEEEP
ncbi:MAG: TIGR02300 family protein [Hyphomicrobiales bacterium]